jgi:hypothetical protein
MKKSFYRVKFYAYLFCAFMIFLYSNSPYYPKDVLWQTLTVTVPFLTIALLLATLKCECCGYALLDRKTDTPLSGFRKVVSLKAFFPSKKCPKCGCERY